MWQDETNACSMHRSNVVFSPSFPSKIRGCLPSVYLAPAAMIGLELSSPGLAGGTHVASSCNRGVQNRCVGYWVIYRVIGHRRAVEFRVSMCLLTFLSGAVGALPSIAACGAGVQGLRWST